MFNSILSTISDSLGGQQQQQQQHQQQQQQQQQPSDSDSENEYDEASSSSTETPTVVTVTRVSGKVVKCRLDQLGDQSCRNRALQGKIITECRFGSDCSHHKHGKCKFAHFTSQVSSVANTKISLFGGLFGSNNNEEGEQESSSHHHGVTGSAVALTFPSELRDGAVHTDWVVEATFSLDGQMMASIGWDHRVLVRNPITGKLIKELKAGQQRALSMPLAFAYDSSVLVIPAGEKSLDIISTKTWKPTGKNLEGHNYPVTCARFSPTKTYEMCSASVDQTAIIWNIQKREKLFTLSVSGIAYSCAYAPSGDSVVVGDASGRITIWNTDDGKMSTECDMSQGKVERLIYSNNGEFFVSSSTGGGVTIWNALGENVVVGKRRAVLESSYGSCAIALSPNDIVISVGSSKGTNSFFLASTGKELCEHHHHRSKTVHATAFDRRGLYVLSGGSDSRVVIDRSPVIEMIWKARMVVFYFREGKSKDSLVSAFECWGVLYNAVCFLGWP